MENDVPPATITIYALGATLGLLTLLRIVQRAVAPAAPAPSETEGDAPRVEERARGSASRLLQVGQLLGVLLVAAAAVKNGVEGASHRGDATWVAISALLGFALAMVTGHLGTRALLRGRLPAEIARGNTAAGIAAGAHYVAAGVLTAEAVAGRDLRGVGLSVAFFVIGQVALNVFVVLFRALTTYDDAEQIQGENVAAALSYAGVTIAIAIVAGRALEGDFSGWSASLKAFGKMMAFALLFYPVRQILVQSLLLGAPLTLRGGELDRGVARGDEGTGAIEAVSYLAVAIAIAKLA